MGVRWKNRRFFHLTPIPHNPKNQSITYYYTRLSQEVCEMQGPSLINGLVAQALEQPGH